MSTCDGCGDHAEPLVHPEHGKPMVFDCRGSAVCRECGASWHLGRDNEVRRLG